MSDPGHNLNSQRCFAAAFALIEVLESVPDKIDRGALVLAALSTIADALGIDAAAWVALHNSETRKHWMHR